MSGEQEDPGTPLTPAPAHLGEIPVTVREPAERLPVPPLPAVEPPEIPGLRWTQRLGIWLLRKELAMVIGDRNMKALWGFFVGKSWVTSLGGYALAVLSLAYEYMQTQHIDFLHALVAAVIAIVFRAAKDGRVTGVGANATTDPVKGATKP